MRIALWYLFSLTVHGSAMALLFWLPLPGHYMPPRFSVSGGGGGGGDDGDGFVQAAFFEVPSTLSAKFAQQALSTPSRPQIVEQEVSTEPVIKKSTHPVEALELPILNQVSALEPQTEVAALHSPASAHVAGPIAMESLEKPLQLPRATARLSPDDLVDASAVPSSAEPLQEQRVATAGTTDRTPGATFAGHSPRVSGRGEGSVGVPGSDRGNGQGGGAHSEMPSALASNPTPSYPPDALARGVEGRVLLRVWIREDGTVQNVKVHQSSGDNSLDESALLTVRERWQFTPAQENGIRVPCEALLPIRFTLHGA